ncbi:MAG TPA: hypothetical protein VIG33_14680 [Pseudobdellovibrionaceae bacterium]|jgi:hypothetical protein
MTQEQLDEAFGPFRETTPVTLPKYIAVRNKVKELAQLINDECPESREKATALTNLQAVKMWANAAIAIHTKPE